MLYNPPRGDSNMTQLFKNGFSYLGLAIAGVFILLGYLYINQNQGLKTSELGLSGKTATVYKTFTCGCCRVYADYLERFGIKVDRRDLPNLTATKREFGVPTSLESCHTTVIDGYTVEGHIPAEAIAKLLKERPNIKGIAMPGMPSGSPGMPGPKEKFTIYELDGKENAKIFLEM